MLITALCAEADLQYSAATLLTSCLCKREIKRMFILTGVGLSSCTQVAPRALLSTTHMHTCCRGKTALKMHFGTRNLDNDISIDTAHHLY